MQELANPIWWAFGIVARKPVHATSLYSYANVAWNAIGLNALPDYLAVIVTGWIIKLAAEDRYPLALLILLDLAADSAIFSLSLLISYALTYASISLVHMPARLGPLTDLLYPMGTHSHGMFANALTTYATSLIWLAFVFTILALAWLKRISGIAVAVLESRLVTELPVVMIVGGLCLLCWPILFAAHLLR